MKVALNCAFLQPKGGGIKEYMVNLVRNLVNAAPDNEYVVYVLKDFEDYAKKTLQGTDVRIKTIPYKTGSAIKKIIRSLTESYFWRKEEKTEKWDLFHSPFFHSPRLKSTPTLLTVHDLRFFRYPETYDRLRAIFLKRAVRRSVLKASHIISISNFTKGELVKAYNLNPDKITVIHEAINPTDFSDAKVADSLPDKLTDKRFILSVGHIEPRKNYERLIQAFRKMKDNNPALDDVRLVIVGKKGCRYEETLKMIEANTDVLYLNFVNHDTLIRLYRDADLFVFPSLYEGFGFPPLEAAALGTPSAVSNLSSIPEVCGDYVVYFDPKNIDEMAAAMDKVLSDENIRIKIIEKLPEMINRFSWKRNADQTVDVYRSIIK